MSAEQPENPLRSARKRRGLSMARLAELAKTSQQQIDRLEKGHRTLSREWAERLAPHLDVTPSSLLFAEPAQADVQQDEASSLVLIEEPEIFLHAGGGFLPSDMHGFSEDGKSYTPEVIRDTWQLPERFVTKTLRASPDMIKIFEVAGDSMYPRLSEGDKVFIDTRYTSPSPEGIFALWDGYGIVVKHVQIVRGSDPLRLRIISANDRYEPYEVLTDQVLIIGRLAGRFTTS